CLGAGLIDAVFDAAREHGAALPAIPVAETVKRVDEQRFTTDTVPREGLYLAQTPQVFRRDILIKAYAQRARAGAHITDDCQLVEASGHHCAVVDGPRFNIKITTHEDLRLAAAILPCLEEPKQEGPSHPYTDQQAIFEKLPKIKASDLFRS